MEQAEKRIVTYLICATVVFSALGLILGGFIEKVETNHTDTESAEFTPTETTTAPTTATTSAEIETKAIKYAGVFKITAYCSCEKCCGKWANERPTDENGAEIVLTASGHVAEEGRTAAVDTAIIPFGTVLIIDGHEYTAEDSGGTVKGNVIDLYFLSHEKAVEYGVEYKEVYTKERNDLI